MDETTVTSMLADAIENLSSHIETLAKNQDYMISVQERTADMLERQAIAIERIVAHLNIAPAQEETRDLPEEEPVMEQPFENHYVTSRRPEPVMAEPVETAVETVSEPARPVIRKRKKVSARPVEKAVQEKPVQSDKKLLGREIIMDIIHTMRADGATFDQVASHLIELGQPTFSGRGEWHAQTIHRLCNKK
jgi:hypothetical protein